MVERRTKVMVPHTWFSNWHQPERFFETVLKKHRLIDPHELFVGPEYQVLIDAFIAGRFAMTRSFEEPCQVRMVARDLEFPDFEIQFANRIEAYESTEADTAGRRRGDEYQARAEQRERGETVKPVLFDPADDVAAAFEAIPRVIAAKAKKLYQPQPHLLVLVNPTGFDWPPDRSATLLQLTRPWRNEFESIWLLWGGFCLRTWPTPCMLVVPPEAHAVDL